MSTSESNLPPIVNPQMPFDFNLEERQNSSIIHLEATFLDAEEKERTFSTYMPIYNLVSKIKDTWAGLAGFIAACIPYFFSGIIIIDGLIGIYKYSKETEINDLTDLPQKLQVQTLKEDQTVDPLLLELPDLIESSGGDLSLTPDFFPSPASAQEKEKISELESAIIETNLDENEQPVVLIENPSEKSNEEKKLASFPEKEHSFREKVLQNLDAFSDAHPYLALSALAITVALTAAIGTYALLGSSLIQSKEFVEGEPENGSLTKNISVCTNPIAETGISTSNTSNLVASNENALVINPSKDLSAQIVARSSPFHRSNLIAPPSNSSLTESKQWFSATNTQNQISSFSTALVTTSKDLVTVPLVPSHLDAPLDSPIAIEGGLMAEHLPPRSISNQLALKQRETLEFRAAAKSIEISKNIPMITDSKNPVPFLKQSISAPRIIAALNERRLVNHKEVQAQEIQAKKFDPIKISQKRLEKETKEVFLTQKSAPEEGDYSWQACGFPLAEIEQINYFFKKNLNALTNFLTQSKIAPPRHYYAFPPCPGPCCPPT